MKIKVADYIFQWLADHNVKHVFLITGGGAMFLNDGLRKESRIMPVFNHHEQACAIAAEGYSRVTGTPGIVCVTSGPGGINTLNGVFGAWTDSIPMIVISGQVKRETCLQNYNNLILRQLGDQEADIISLVKGITKYSAFIDHPQDILFHLEKAWITSQDARPGPCWLDIPLDVQSAIIETEELKRFESNRQRPDSDFNKEIQFIAEKIRMAKRPVFLVGSGIRQASFLDRFREVIRNLAIPVIVSRSALDILTFDDPYFCGRSGIDAERAGNINLQNADLVIIIGCRMGLRQVGYNRKSYLRNAYTIHVDIDKNELNKPHFTAELIINRDLCAVFEELNRFNINFPLQTEDHKKWLNWCKTIVYKFHATVTTCDKTFNEKINPYYFLTKLYSQLNSDEVIVCGNGSAFIMTFQVAKILEKQRLFFNSGCASMGYDLPAAIGASMANRQKRVICIAGDGSLELNIQELQTIVNYNLDIKIFVINNNGYLSMRIGQKSYFEGCIGESPESGLTFPDFIKLANAYGIKALHIKEFPIEERIDEVLKMYGAVLCLIDVDPNQEFEPRVTSKVQADGTLVSPSIEDMYPFLPTDVLKDNMLVSLWD